jgi:hypothetical protein
VSGYLVGSTAFKAAETSDPRLAGSIPVHLRHKSFVANGYVQESKPTATKASETSFKRSAVLRVSVDFPDMASFTTRS